MAKNEKPTVAPTQEPVSADKKAREQRGPKKRVTQYGIQLCAKQKVKQAYGLREKQFRKYYEKAKASKEVTGQYMLLSLKEDLTMWCIAWVLPQQEEPLVKLLATHKFVLMANVLTFLLIK